MKLNPQVIEFILNSKSKAFATSGEHSLNVVPVSTIRIVDNKILLMNYFMKKTVTNILKNSHVALVYWKGLEGYQIKGTVSYLNEGLEFENAAGWIQENLKDLVLKGLIVLEPEEIHDIALRLE